MRKPESSIVVLLFALLLAAPRGAGAAGRPPDPRKLLGSREADDRIAGIRLVAERPGRSALRLLLEALADPEPEVRDAAERAVLRRTAPEDLSALATDGLRHRDPRIRTVALRALADARVTGLDDLLSEALEDRDPGVREAAVGITSNVLGARGTDRLAAAADRGREGRPRAAALLALARLDPRRAAALAVPLRGFPAMEVRVAALEVIAAGGGEDAPSFLIGALSDENWSVRLTAIRGLTRLACPAAVLPLIDALGREGGRMKEEVNGALAALTGAGLPPDPDRWRRFWEEHEGELAPEPEHPRPGEGGDGGSVATFHSIPVTSRGVAFLLDRSGSMKRGLTRKEGRTKAAMVEAELGKTLGKLDSSARLFLVAFGTEPVAFLPRPAPATPGLRRRALEWFCDQAPAGRTNLSDALALALEQEDVDSIFVLTDGAPSAGEERTRTGILDAVARQNRYRKAVIHTVEIGGETTGKKWNGFLAELARRTGGRHVRR